MMLEYPVDGIQRPWIGKLGIHRRMSLGGLLLLCQCCLVTSELGEHTHSFQLHLELRTEQVSPFGS
jgi:hypothetical protein